MARYDDIWWYPPSRPLPAKGGIRSRTRKGAFAESWWGRRWIETLEGFPIAPRLERGRSYARRGQVLSIDIEPGVVSARVQGSRKQPYRVSIRLAPLSLRERRAVARAAAAQARVAASLLAGEMPEALEQVFRVAGVSLFPERHGDLETECSCPDWSNPCKHVAAVYYLIAEELDRNPFFLLRLRGLDRATLAEAVSRKGAAPGPTIVPPVPSGTPLPSDPDAFWNGTPDEEEAAPVGEDGAAEGGDAALLSGRAPGGPAAHHPPALLTSLGRPPFWKGHGSPEETLDEMTARAADLAAALLAGEE